MPSQEVLTLLIDAKNLASKELVGLQKDLRKASEDSDRLGLVMGRLGTVAKAGLAAGFAVAAKGAMDLQEIQAKLQADTGKSADEAHRMALAINNIAGSTATALPVVADAFSKVVTDLGVTGQAADDMTKLFIRFGKVTGQDVSQAVLAFDDILDSWGLTVEETTKLMDVLQASHQKYGGSVIENQAALIKLAPAMLAFNMTTADAIMLLNLFAASGVDAEAAATSIIKAVGKFESPDEFRAFLKTVSETEDPLKRAQLAIEKFGKSGAALGNALAGVDLTSFGMSFEQAAGTITTAGEAIENTLPAQFARAFSEVQARTREFGDWFGPSIGIIGSVATSWQVFGAPLADGIGKRIIAAVASTEVGAAAIAGGKVIGTTISGAAGTAFGALLPVALAAGIALIAYKTVTEPLVNGIMDNTLAGMKEKIPTLSRDVMVSLRDGLRSLIGVLNFIPDGGLIVGAQRERIMAGIDTLNVAIAEKTGTGGIAAADTFAETFAGSTARLVPPIGSAIGEGVSAPAVAAVADAAKTVAEKAGGMMDEVASRIRTARSDILAAMRTAMGGSVEAENAQLQITVNKAEIAAQKKILASSKYTTAEKAQAQIRINNLRTENATLEIEAALASGDRKKIAEAAAKALKKAMASEDPVIKQNWLDLHKKLKDELEKTAAAAEKYGQKTAENYAAGLGSKYAQKLVQDRAITIAEKAADALKTFSPSKVGPFSKGRGPEDMGLRLGELWAKGLAESGSAVGRSAEKIATTAARPLGGPPAVGLRTGRASATAMAHAAPVTLTVNSTFPPTNAQVAGWVDLIDREMRRRQPRYSAYATGV